MRILTVGNRYPPEGFGGYEVLWQDAVAWLRERGHEVTVLTTDRPSPRGERDVLRELQWYWEDHEFPRRRLRERLAIERHNAKVLAGVIDERRPERVAWFSMGGMSLSLIAQVQRRGIPAVGVVADEWLAYGPRVDAWTRMWLHLPWPPTFAGIPTQYRPAAAARWLFISNTLVARTVKYKVDAGQPLVAHPGVDPDVFSERPAHDWRGDLLYAGRIDSRKGIATAVRALPALPRMTLSVDGDGDMRHRDELGELAAELDVGGRLVFGRTDRDRLCDRYGSADVVLHPVEWEEPWGLAPLEAMAAGTPVVATGMGGSGEYLRDGENALLVPARDEQALAKAVSRLRDEPELRAALRRGGLETASRFHASSFFEALERALAERTA